MHPLGARATALALVLLSLACGSREERFAAHLERAGELAAEERVDDALIELQGALKLDPDSALANERMAALLRERGALRRAALHFGEAYRLDSTRVAALIAQAELLWASEPQRARRIIARARRRHPEDPRVLRAESALALRAGDPEGALASAESALVLDRSDRESWLQLASVRRARALRARGEEAQREELARAIEAYDELERIAGLDVEARVGRAHVHASWPGHEEPARAAFRSALDLAVERGDSEARRRAAVALERHARAVGDLALRREALLHQTAAAPKRLGAWERLAAVSETLLGEEAGLAVYRELLRASPASPAAHIGLSAQLARGGRVDEAVAHLEGAIEADVDDPRLREQLVRLELSRGRVAAARAQATRLSRRHPEAPVSRRAAARVALAVGDAEAAAALLDAIPEAEASAEVEALRARVELARGRPVRARAAADRAVALASGFSAPAQRLVARIHAETGDWITARAALHELERHGIPLGADERLIRARAAYESGDAPAGRVELLALLERPDPPADAALVFARREGREHPDAARAHLERAHARHPSHLGVLEALVRRDLAGDAAPTALERIERAVGENPPTPALLQLRAEVLAHAGRFAEAEVDALRALEATPDLPRAVELLFAIYRAKGRLAEVRRSFEEAEAAGVLHGGARVLLGRLYLAAGDVRRARETFERVVEDSPEIASAKNDLAFMLATSGEQLERALGLAEEGHRALPESPNAADTLGYVLLRLARPAEALAHFREAIGVAAEDDASLPTFHYHAGLALDALGRPGEAAHHLERALASGTAFPGADDAERRLRAAREAMSRDAERS